MIFCAVVGVAIARRSLLRMRERFETAACFGGFDGGLAGGGCSGVGHSPIGGEAVRIHAGGDCARNSTVVLETVGFVVGGLDLVAGFLGGSAGVHDAAGIY